MKKYDFLLLGLYILFFAAIFLFLVYIHASEVSERKVAKAHFEELYQQPVKQVMVRDTDLKINVVKGRMPQPVKSGFVFSGILSEKAASCFQVSGDTLYISGAPDTEQVALVLYLKADIQVDTIRSPFVSQVEIQSE